MEKHDLVWFSDVQWLAKCVVWMCWYLCFHRLPISHTLSFEDELPEPLPWGTWAVSHDDSYNNDWCRWRLYLYEMVPKVCRAGYWRFFFVCNHSCPAKPRSVKSPKSWPLSTRVQDKSSYFYVLLLRSAIASAVLWVYSYRSSVYRVYECKNYELYSKSTNTIFTEPHWSFEARMPFIPCIDLPSMNALCIDAPWAFLEFPSWPE